MRQTTMHLALLLLFAGLARAEPIENPDYAKWAKFPAGSKVTLRGVNSQRPGTAYLTTMTLKSVSKTAVVLVIEERTVSGGKTQKKPAREQTLAAQVDPATLRKPPKPISEKTGKETLEIDGREIVCAWREVRVGSGGGLLIRKEWTSDTVPGHTVKLTGGVEGMFTATQVLTAVHVPDSKR